MSTDSNKSSTSNITLHHLHLKFNLHIIKITIIVALMKRKQMDSISWNSVASGGAYRYSNKDGSYDYYQNSDGSKYLYRWKRKFLLRRILSIIFFDNEVSAVTTTFAHTIIGGTFKILIIENLIVHNSARASGLETHRGDTPVSGGSYHYSNLDNSCYYQNPDDENGFSSYKKYKSTRIMEFFFPN
ncbi:hypothetical protein GLOIN_2v1885096 [Rhizophagus irregularis DAOM 181602=DAOM 197198]|nr:hypothetical protein GLOIN_2v1885096 [Rhizophagus irregularis DAOM 181602=DAOM 197198]